MKIRPLYDRILLAPVAEDRTTKGGLVIPDVAAESRPYAYADVIAVGEGRPNPDGTVMPLRVRVGDVVAFPRKSGAVFPLGDEHVVMIRESDLVGVVEDLPRDTGLTAANGARLLSMLPTSRAMPDVAYKNREDLERAEREGFGDGAAIDEPNDHT